MNKIDIFTQFITLLESNYQIAITSAEQAHQTATDDQNIAENKYDTLAVEAAYLAHGQSVRVEQCKADIKCFTNLQGQCEQFFQRACLGALVSLNDQQNKTKHIFLAPCSGGLTSTYNGQNISVVTLHSPLGMAIKGAQIGDEINVKIAARDICYEITNIS